MTATAHVPARELAEQAKPKGITQLEVLGGRLIKLGAALQNPSSAVSELVDLADACGLQLRIRVVEDRQ